MDKSLIEAAPELLDVAQEMLLEVHATRLALIEAIDPQETGETADELDKIVLRKLDDLIDRSAAAIRKARGKDG